MQSWVLDKAYANGWKDQHDHFKGKQPYALTSFGQLLVLVRNVTLDIELRLLSQTWTMIEKIRWLAANRCNLHTNK